MVVVPNVMVMAWLGMKLLPVTVTLVPTGPELGLEVRAGVVTVKEQLKLPLESEVHELGVVVVMVVLPIVMLMGWLGMKLVPVTVTLVPTGPELGLEVRAGVVTVNGAVGAFVVAFVPSLAVTVV